MKINQLRLKDKKLYLIVEYDSYNNEDDLLDDIAKELEKGMQIIHLDCGHVNTKKILGTGKKIRELCSIYGALLIVGDRIDIVQVIESDGVFLNKNSFSIKEARELIGNTIIIGTDYEVDGADYLLSNYKITKLKKTLD